LSLAVQASYTLRTILANAKYLPRGSKSVLYELLDEFGVHDPNNGETGFGLIDTTTTPWTPKPAYNALRALMLLMEDNGESWPDGDVPFNFTGGVGTTEYLATYWTDSSYGGWVWDTRSIYDRVAHTPTTVATTTLSIAVPAGTGSVLAYDPIATGLTASTLTPSSGLVTVACSANNPKLVKFTS
jgi:hypothetical protein